MIILKTNFQIHLGSVEELPADMSAQWGLKDCKFLTAHSAFIFKK